MSLRPVRLFAPLLVALLTLSLTARAADEPKPADAAPKAEAKKPDDKKGDDKATEGKVWTTKHTVHMGATVVAYTATAGTMLMKNDKDEPIAQFGFTAINRGTSGGPLFNMDGQVIGINTAIFSPSGGSIGIGFSIPSNMAKNIVNQLRDYGHPRRGWLGVKIQQVTPDIAESLGLKDASGAMIAADTSPRASIRIGDGARKSVWFRIAVPSAQGMRS